MSQDQLGSAEASSVKLLIIPGLNDSPPDHWQSWLQRSHGQSALRVTQRSWSTPDVDRWSARIDAAVHRDESASWLAVAHSFGAVALMHYLAQAAASPVVAALLVAPADPDGFGVGGLMPQHEMPIPGTLVLSRTDPWLSLHAGRRWAQRWRWPVVDLGDAGHINVASGHGTLPFAQLWVETQQARLARPRRVATPAQPESPLVA